MTVDTQNLVNCTLRDDDRARSATAYCGYQRDCVRLICVRMRQPRNASGLQNLRQRRNARPLLRQLKFVRP